MLSEGRVVTLQGELFHPAGPIMRPAQGEAASAEQRFRQAEAALVRVEQELRAAEAERGQALSSLEREQAEGGVPASHLEHQISLARENEAVARGISQRLQAQLDAAQAELAGLQERRAAGQAEAATLRSDLEGWKRDAETVGLGLQERSERHKTLQAE